MESNRRKKVILGMIIVFLIVCVAGGYFAKVKYDEHQEKVRIENIKNKNNEIKTEYSKFDKEEDRSKKLDIVKNFESDYNKYKKSENKYDECVKEYSNKLSDMKKFFTDDYDKTIANISSEIGDDVNNFGDKDKLNTFVTTLTDLKNTIKSEYENYNIIDKNKYESYNKTIDENIQSYSGRVSAIQKQEEEEAAKKAEEAKAAQEAANAATSSGSSSGSNGYAGSNYSGGSGSGSGYSGGSSSGSSHGKNNGYSSWSYVEDGNGNKTYEYGDSSGNVYDSNGNYLYNGRDWM